MTQTRIYVPLGATSVRRLAQSRSLASEVIGAFAVTERLERSLPGADEEQWEYAALCHAVEAAGALRESETDKRVVAAADVDASAVSPRAGESGVAVSAVEVAGPLPLERVVSFHLDEEPGADGVDDLLWYDVTELDDVVRLL